jgi:hypothetical protein
MAPNAWPYCKAFLISEALLLLKEIIPSTPNVEIKADVHQSPAPAESFIMVSSNL